MKLHDLVVEYKDKGRREIESLDFTRPTEMAALRERLPGRSFDMLFVNAGTPNNNQGKTIAVVSTDEFVRVMVANVLSPMLVVERLQDLVSETGVIGIMSSGQGGVSNNEKSGHEVYPGSKAAFNMYMRGYAATVQVKRAPWR